LQFYFISLFRSLARQSLLHKQPFITAHSSHTISSKTTASVVAEAAFCWIYPLT